MAFTNEQHVDAPTGKTTIRGTIISTKAKDGDYGTTYRMTVKVTTAAGIYLVNSTIPAALFDACEASGLSANGGWLSVLRGCEVQFTATLEHGNDRHFAFGKRPTKATLTNIPADKARLETYETAAA